MAEQQTHVVVSPPRTPLNTIVFIVGLVAFPVVFILGLIALAFILSGWRPWAWL